MKLRGNEGIGRRGVKVEKYDLAARQAIAAQEEYLGRDHRERLNRIQELCAQRKATVRVIRSRQYDRPTIRWKVAMYGGQENPFIGRVFGCREDAVILLAKHLGVLGEEYHYKLRYGGRK